MPHVLCMPGGSGGAAFPLACSSPRCSLPAVRVCRHCLHSPATDAQVWAEAEPGDLRDAARMLPTPVQPTGWDPAVPGGSRPSASLPTHSISCRAARPRSAGSWSGGGSGGGDRLSIKSGWWVPRCQPFAMVNVHMKLGAKSERPGGTGSPSAPKAALVRARVCVCLCALGSLPPLSASPWHHPSAVIHYRLHELFLLLVL